MGALTLLFTCLIPFLGALQEESVSPADLKKALKSTKEPEERKDLLQQIAALAVEGNAKFATESAKILASALEDENNSVRQESVRLLMLSPAKNQAVEALADGLEALRVETASLGRGAFGGGGGRGGPGAGDPGKEEDPEAAAKAAELRAEAQGRLDYGMALVNGLAELPDDRSVDALTRFLERADRQVLDRFGSDLIGALLGLGSREAVGKVIDMLPLMTDPAARAGKVEDPGNGGRGGGGRGGRPKDGKDLHQMLSRFAAKKELGEAPEWGIDGPDHWEKWFAKNRKNLPAKLGKLSDPK